MPKEVIIKLEYGEVKLDLNIEGVSGIAAVDIVEEAFKLFKSEMTKPASIREAFSDMVALEPMEPDRLEPIEDDTSETIVAEARDSEETELEEEKPKVEIPIANKMEELLKDISPLSYRIYGDTYRFQVYYICDNCSHKGRAFVERRPSFKCRECGKTMKLIPATNEKFPHVDQFGNFFVAGKYKQNSVYLQEQESKAEEAVYQFMLEEEMVNQKEEDRPKKLRIK